MILLKKIGMAWSSSEGEKVPTKINKKTHRKISY